MMKSIKKCKSDFLKKGGSKYDYIWCTHWCQALLNFHKHINSYLQTEHKVIDL